MYTPQQIADMDEYFRQGPDKLSEKNRAIYEEAQQEVNRMRAQILKYRKSLERDTEYYQLENLRRELVFQIGYFQKRRKAQEERTLEKEHPGMCRDMCGDLLFRLYGAQVQWLRRQKKWEEGHTIDYLGGDKTSGKLELVTREVFAERLAEKFKNS